MHQETTLQGGVSLRSVTDRPYSPSWFDRLLNWIEQLPGPVWVYLLALLVIQFLYINAWLWLNGMLPFGTFDIGRAYFVIITPYILADWIYLGGVARRAMAFFRPALAVSDAEFDRLQYELLTLPARPALILTFIGVIGYLIFVALLPLTIVQEYAPSRLEAALQGMPVHLPLAILAWLGVYRAFHELQLVSDLHHLARAIELHNTLPLYAFSALTARIAISLLIPIYYIFVVRQDMVLKSPPLLGLCISAILVAIGCFVMPLREMHMRLVAEKGKLLEQVSTRFHALTAQLHRRVDADQLEGMDDLNKALASLVIERETIERIPTYPWERGTLTGFVTALIVPIVLWFITRLLERVL